MSKKEKTSIIVHDFVPDGSRTGRVLYSAKVRGVYVSRLVLDPGTKVGGYYYKKTVVTLYVGSGSVLGKFENITTKERKEFPITMKTGAIHLPAGVAISLENKSKKKATVIIFSDARLQTGDDYLYNL
ncbi:MAG: hypothetical protein CL685_02280 [Candidatus Magasanikbacteria bacterium]|nr:hypothetical protein [Candidatus Magasanikbacteria bacterium]|tara:strand:- start:4770 stop:5153 length:384 start_codon:yes stop_codon:yes gene_type:complete